jgi:diguanylate cyclase (GGDEF)-like protein
MSRRQIDAYVRWIRDLKAGVASSPPSEAGSDIDVVLASLGREIEQLWIAMSRREQQLLKLIDLVRSVNQGLKLEDVLENIFDGFANIIPFDRIGCAFLDEDQSLLTAHWAKSRLGELHLPPGYAQDVAGTTLEAVMNSGHPRIINNLEEYLEQRPTSDSTSRIVAEGGRSSLTCPLAVYGQPLGFLFFTSGRVEAYHHVHQTIFREIATEVAAVIHKSRLLESLEARNRTLIDYSAHLELVALTDALTGVLNRRAIDSKLQNRWLEYQTSGRRFAVIMADIDHFKQINDSAGHSRGDLVLKELTSRLCGHLRKHDAIGRYGGEEFLLIVDDVTGLQLADLADRLRLAVAERAFEATGPFPITASFGAALADPSLESPFDLVELADQALYRAKALGRNRCELAEPAAC